MVGRVSCTNFFKTTNIILKNSIGLEGSEIGAPDASEFL